MAAGIEPPKRVFAHGWWTNEGQKISKSVGNVIDPFELVEKYGLDPVRYFLLRQVPFGNDGDFSHQAMVHRLNGDLANDLGNLCQRVMSMVFRNCDGKIPESHSLNATDEQFVTAISDSLDDLRTLMEAQAFHQALELIWRHVADANRMSMSKRRGNFGRVIRRVWKPCFIPWRKAFAISPFWRRRLCQTQWIKCSKLSRSAKRRGFRPARPCPRPDLWYPDARQTAADFPPDCRRRRRIVRSCWSIAIVIWTIWSGMAISMRLSNAPATAASGRW